MAVLGHHTRDQNWFEIRIVLKAIFARIAAKGSQVKITPFILYRLSEGGRIV